MAKLIQNKINKITFSSVQINMWYINTWMIYKKKTNLGIHKMNISTIRMWGMKVLDYWDKLLVFGSIRP